MNKKTAAIIGLVGAILILVSFALPWAFISALGFSLNIDGISLVTGSITLMGQTANVGTQPDVVVVLLGGIIALVGGIGLMAGKRMLGFLTPIGGLLAIIGGVWGVVEAGGALTA